MNQRIPLLPKRKTPVTLIVGIKCKDAVVLASDSQITYGTNKRTDGAKMEVIDFDGIPVMAAQSGSILFSNRFVDILSGLAAKATVSSADDICILASQAMRTLRNEQREVHFGCTSEELSEIFRKDGTGVGVMLGFFINNSAHLVSINLHHATAQKCRSFYDADGCGSPLGLYLLGEYASPGIPHSVAAILAIYVVELVKKHDAMCGGDTRVAVLRDHETGMPSSGEYPKQYVEKCAALLLKADEDAKPVRLKTFQERILSDDFKVMETIYFPRGFF